LETNCQLYNLSVNLKSIFLKKYSILASLLVVLFTIPATHAQVPTPQQGRVVRHENFPSAQVTPRHVDVWLPAAYDPQKKYAVLYMHDGQMLFDSTLTWNKQEWGVDETLSQLMREKKIKDCIVVGIWNGGRSRHAEYFPQKPFESLTKTQQEIIYNAYRSNGQSIFFGIPIMSDRYLNFLTQELKPFIDKTYSTKTDRNNTFIAGSSMGALISLYAICEYPAVFGGAACLSTHWPGLFTMENNPVPGAFFSYLEQSLPSPKNHRLYFDHGTETLDSMYASLQKSVDQIMGKRGYKSQQWVSRSWPGQDHSERSWRSRFSVPATFLLKK
jgi:predicted alpha/beta superfamily hydrolase